MTKFLLGVMAGIVAGLLIPGIRSAIFYYVGYIYQKLSGSAVDLTDTWDAKFIEVDHQGQTLNSKERIRLKHHGRHLYGDAEIEGPYPRRFKFYGALFHDLVYGHYEKAGTHLGSLEGRGVYLLKIDQTRSKMFGYCSWFDKDSRKIESSSYEWERL